jgi:hypothetical protein
MAGKKRNYLEQKLAIPPLSPASEGNTLSKECSQGSVRNGKRWFIPLLGVHATPEYLFFDLPNKDRESH